MEVIIVIIVIKLIRRHLLVLGGDIIKYLFKAFSSVLGCIVVKNVLLMCND